QEDIGVFQPGRHVVVDQARRLLAAQGGEQVGALQRRQASTSYQLGELYDELDLPDSAFAELDVVYGIHAGACQSTPLPVLADAFTQLAQGDRKSTRLNSSHVTVSYA